MPTTRIRTANWSCGARIALTVIAVLAQSASPSLAQQIDGAQLEFVGRIPNAAGQYPAHLTPTTELVLTPAGDFYGATRDSSTNRGGTAFRRTPAGTVTTLYAFSGGAAGDGPRTLLLGTDGNLYGTTDYGGASDCGTVFRLTLAGVFTVLHSFACEPGGTQPTVTQGTDGNFYGTTHSGGPARLGTVYRLTPLGDFSTLHTFTGNFYDGTYPVGVVQRSDGRLFGTTAGNHVLAATCYLLDPVTGAFDWLAGGVELTYGPPARAAGDKVYFWRQSTPTQVGYAPVTEVLSHDGRSAVSTGLYLTGTAANVQPVGVPLVERSQGVVHPVIGVVSTTTASVLFGPGPVRQYDGARNALFRLTAGLTQGPDGSWYSVGAFPHPTSTDSYVVRFRR